VPLEPGDKIGYLDPRGVRQTAYVTLVQWPYCYATRKHTDTAITLLWDVDVDLWQELE
jgi:hypothetical protein